MLLRSARKPSNSIVCAACESSKLKALGHMRDTEDGVIASQHRNLLNLHFNAFDANKPRAFAEVINHYPVI